MGSNPTSSAIRQAHASHSRRAALAHLSTLKLKIEGGQPQMILSDPPVGGESKDPGKFQTRMFRQESWEAVADFTVTQRGGVNIDELLKHL